MNKKPKIEWHNIEVAIKTLKSLAVNGTIPNASEMRRRYGRRFRFGINKHGGYRSVARLAGLKIRKSFPASDGHILYSYYEYLFDEYLFLNGIQHEIDGYICDDSRARYDFKIGSVYVEIWGISATSKCFNNYSERRHKKEQLYKKHGLTIVSFSGGDFKRSSCELQDFFRETLLAVGIKSSQQKNYPVFNRRRLDYWNEGTVIKELREYVKAYGKFPTANDLLDKRNDLRCAIRLFGGYRKFAILLGFTPQTKPYSQEYVVTELRSVKKSIGHFPCDRELQEMKRSDLAGMIKKHGGYGYFKELAEGKRDKRPFGYWRDEANIIAELKQLTERLGHFPLYSELGIVATGVNRSKKGMKYFERIVMQ